MTPHVAAGRARRIRRAGLVLLTGLGVALGRPVAYAQPAAPPDPATKPRTTLPVTPPIGAKSNSLPEGQLLPAQPVKRPWGGQQLNPFEPLSSRSPLGTAAAATTLPLDSALPPGTHPVQMAALTTNTIPRADEVTLKQPSRLPPGTREGVFQKVTFTGTWLPALSDEPDTLGLGELDTSVVFGFPLFQRETPLLVTPRFEANLLDNASALDLPSELYGASVEFRHLRKFAGTPWAMDVATTIGYYSDFEVDSGDAVRVSGRGLAVYEGTPGTQWILGVVYLNRAGASVLPVAGVIHKPSADTRWELIFPRPRLAWRTQGSVPTDEGWFYLGAEFGGGVWSITRPSTGTPDLLQYSDYRLMAGYERKRVGGLTRRFEVGYVFNRELEFNGGAPDTSLDDSVFGRVGVSY